VSPSAPAMRPLYRAPCAWHASSSTRRPFSFANSTMGSIDAAWPNRWTGMIALVRFVSARGRRAGSMLYVVASMSVKRTRAPV